MIEYKMTKMDSGANFSVYAAEEKKLAEIWESQKSWLSDDADYKIEAPSGEWEIFRKGMSHNIVFTVVHTLYTSDSCDTTLISTHRSKKKAVKALYEAVEKYILEEKEDLLHCGYVEEDFEGWREAIARTESWCAEAESSYEYLSTGFRIAATEMEEAEHYLVINEWAENGSGGRDVLAVCHTLSEAENRFSKILSGQKNDAQTRGWTIFEDVANSCFFAGEEDYAAGEYTKLYIECVPC